ncbi:MAG TPA: hypothetical protein VF006_08240 [Longimicrobium sp.]
MISRSTSRTRWMAWGPAVGVVLAGAALGWWMFSFRGLALFAAAGAFVAIAYRLLATYASGLAAALALVLAAAALHSASTLGWGGADVADGSRFKASPVGLSHVLTPDRPASRTVDCGWHAASGYAAPCAVARGGDAAFRRLRAVYPVVLAAVFLCVAGAVASLRPAWRLRGAHRVAAGGAAAAALLAVALFAASVGQALASLQGVRMGTGGSLGTMQLSAGVLLCLAACLSPAPERSPGRPGRAAAGLSPRGPTAPAGVRPAA